MGLDEVYLKYKSKIKQKVLIWTVESWAIETLITEVVSSEYFEVKVYSLVFADNIKKQYASYEGSDEMGWNHC